MTYFMLKRRTCHVPLAQFEMLHSSILLLNNDDILFQQLINLSLSDLKVLYGAEPRGLSLNEKLLPQYLKELGYANHIVGKWHLGFFKREYTPTFRGFRTHTGFWTGRHDYYDHISEERVSRELYPRFLESVQQLMMSRYLQY